MRTAIAMALAALAGVSVLAQQQQPQAPPAGTPTFKSTTRLIVQTVTVKDKDGKPIEGLTAKDFIVTEDNEPQTISFVEFQRLPPRSTGSVTIGDAAPEATPDPLTAPPAKKVESVTDVKIKTVGCSPSSSHKSETGTLSKR